MLRSLWSAVQSWPRHIQLLAAAACAACAIGLGAVLSLLLVDPAISGKLQDKVAKAFAKPAAAPGDTRSFDWRRIETSLLSVERVDIDLGAVSGVTWGGAIDQFHDAIVYGAASGRIGFVYPEKGEISYSDVRAPMNYDENRRDFFGDKPRFNQNFYRLMDIMIVPDASGERADLYVAHHNLQPDTLTICLDVSRTGIAWRDDAVVFENETWTRVYRTNACIDMNETDWQFNGHMAGGRMAPADDDHFLLTVGTFGIANFDARYDEVQAGSDYDFGKLIKVNYATGESVKVAGGLRNPQGLAWDSHGRIWAAGHGAQSGDEVNIIREGEDYGWPNVTVGMDYGEPRDVFPLNPKQGRHKGYAPPVFSFMPAVAPSNLIAVSGDRQFSRWADDIIVTAMKDMALYRLRPEGDAIIYSERIEMGVRPRDIMQLDDGSLAVLADEDMLILLRQAEPDAPFEPVTIAGYDSVGAIVAEAEAADKSNGWGRRLFTARCATCHRMDGETEVGPALDDVVGRKVAGVEDYPYSDALLALGGNWSPSRLEAFIADPEAVAPGANMREFGSLLNVYERRAIVDYLAGRE